MPIYYSPSNHGFFDDTVHEEIPDDRLEVPEGQHLQMVEAINTEGRAIIEGPPGFARVGDVLPLPPVTLQQARLMRDRLLQESDWTQLSDVPKATRDAWKEYRQKLRDITARASFPDAVEWPVKPNANHS
jgi:hypothetical protein